MLPFSFSKKSIFSLAGILLTVTVIVILIAFLITGLTKKAAQANAAFFTVELPESNYQDLAPNQQKSLLDQLGQRFPIDQEIPIVPTITFAQENQVLPDNLSPFEGDGQVDPLNPEPKDELLWPYFHFTWAYPGPGQGEVEPQLEALKIKALVEKYYPVAVELFGLPNQVSGRHIVFMYDQQSNFFGYLPQYDTVMVTSSNPYEIIPGLLMAFYGQYFSLLPETWRYGMVYTVAELAINRFPEDVDQSVESFMTNWRSHYEKYNVANFPIWGTSLHYPQDLNPFDKKKRVALATAAFLKPYQNDQPLCVKINQKIITLDSSADLSDDLKLGKELESAWPTVEGLSPGDWYNQQHVLHQTQTNPLAILAMRLFGQLLVVMPDSNPQLHSFKSHVTDNGLIFIPKENKNFQMKITNDIDQAVSGRTLTTNGYGYAQIDSPFDAGLTAAGRYHFAVNNQGTDSFYFPSDPGSASLFGAVLNFGSGLIEVYQGGNLIDSSLVVNGGFVFNQPLAGVLELKLKDYQGNLVLEKELAKFPGRYFTLLDSPSRSYPPGPPIGSGSAELECGQDLPNLYSSTKYNFSIRYPDGFEVLDSSGQESYNPDPSQPLISESVVQFLNQTSGADNFIGGSMITVIWHDNVNDQAIDDFSRNYMPSETGQVRMWEACGKEFVEFSFKTMSEPFENPTAAPTEVELKTYFIADGRNVYIISSSRDELAVTALLKMLESIQFASDSGNLIPCSQDLFNTAGGLIEDQENWWEKPAICADVPDNPVCGHIRSLYEGGQESESAQTYRNACTYCKIFDQTGYRGLRGTKMYSLGYQKGACQ